jgi:hypothetical protein
VPDPQDLKRRAFDAFGEQLARMRDRSPLVLLLDDTQWLDQHSVMRATLVHPEPVPLLLACAHRSEGAEHNALLQPCGKLRAKLRLFCTGSDRTRTRPFASRLSCLRA